MPKSANRTRPKHSVHIRINLDTHEVLRSHAASRQLSTAWVINDILDRAAKVLKANAPG